MSDVGGIKIGSELGGGKIFFVRGVYTGSKESLTAEFFFHNAKGERG